MMENPTKMDDLGVPLFSETSIFCQVYVLLENHCGFFLGTMRSILEKTTTGGLKIWEPHEEKPCGNGH